MKFLQYIGILVLSLLIASCNSGSDVSDGSGSGSTEVSVSIGERSGGSSAELSPELFPAEIISFRFTVTGPNMDPMEQIVNVVGTDPFTVIFIVPNGYRCFSIYASDAPNGEGTVLYSGVTCQDIGGGPETVTVFMQLQLACDLYVDVETGDDDTNDGSQALPYETITKAIFEAGDRPILNASICIAAGTYYGTTGYGYGYGYAGGSPPRVVGPGNEIFPLELLSGMSLICTGADRTTVIDAYDSWSTAILSIDGPGASVEGCTVIVDEDWTGIYSDQQITIDNVLIESGGCCGFAYEGIALRSGSDGSVISNSTIRNIDSVDGDTAISVDDSNVTITDNVIEDNASGGIVVWGGTSLISGNTINNNFYFGINIDGGTSTITNNDIYDNDVGIYVDEATVTIRDSEIYCNNDADLISDSTIEVDAINNSWDHDSLTVPNGPTIDLFNNCLGGVDICKGGGGYSGNPVPLYDPFNSAVPGGCL